jgi:hypothetical protein
VYAVDIQEDVLTHLRDTLGGILKGFGIHII